MTSRMTHTRSGSSPRPAGSSAVVRTRPPGTRPDLPADLVPPVPGGVPTTPETVRGGSPEGSQDEELRPVTPTPAMAGPAAVAPVARPDDRRAQRAARRQRRHLALWCAVLIAVCLAITILIVIMAGNHTPGTQAYAAPGSTAARSLVGPASVHPSTGGGASAPGGGRG